MTYFIGVATLIGVLAAVAQLTALRKQRRRDFEDFFVHRYWKIMDDLSLEGLMCKKPSGGQIRPEDEKAVIAFLRLSEDEADLRRNGWISASTWRLWWEGIIAQLHRWPFDEVWTKVCAHEDDIQKESSSAKRDDQFQTLRGEARRHIQHQTFWDPGPKWTRPFNGP